MDECNVTIKIKYIGQLGSKLDIDPKNRLNKFVNMSLKLKLIKNAFYLRITATQLVMTEPSKNVIATKHFSIRKMNSKKLEMLGE